MLKIIVVTAVVVCTTTSCGPSDNEGFAPAADSFTVDTAAVAGELRPIGIVAPDFFRDVQPLLGRLFADYEYADDTPTAVAIVSHPFWSEHLESRPNAIGSRLEIRGTPHTIIGVMPRGVNVPSGVAAWIPR